MTLEEQIARADRAKLLYEDPLIQEALADMKAAIIGQWTDLSIENKTQAEELKRLLWATQQFESIFTVTIGGGAVARNELLADATRQRAESVRKRIYG
jgi:exo-beta-1,3-glucanase (GH17 family)